MCFGGGGGGVQQPQPQTPPQVLTHVPPDPNGPGRYKGKTPLPNLTGRHGGPLLVDQQQKLGE
jgi:hypothetical protein